MMLLCSGAGGLKADCAFCPSGSGAAECIAVGSSLLVIKPFHFQNRDLLVSAMGGLQDLKREWHPLIRDELSYTYQHVQRLTWGEKYQRRNWVFSSVC